MKAIYNKSKIFRNAWYLKKANASMSFSACLRKAWRNEKLAVMTAIIENRRGRTAPQHLLRKLKNSEILAKPR